MESNLSSSLESYVNLTKLKDLYFDDFCDHIDKIFHGSKTLVIDKSLEKILSFVAGEKRKLSDFHKGKENTSGETFVLGDEADPELYNCICVVLRPELEDLERIITKIEDWKEEEGCSGNDFSFIFVPRRTF